MTACNVFLSHAAEDRAVVEVVLKSLRSRIGKLRYWVDFETLKPGQDWAEEIIRAASASSVFLLVGTKAAFESRWVQHEVGIALQRRLFDKIPLIILAFDPSVIPSDLQRYQYVDFHDEAAGMTQLEEFLTAEFLGKPKSTPVEPMWRRFPPGTVLNFFDCPGNLRECTRGELRFRLSAMISRNEIAVLWFDVFGSRMDDQIPGLPIANCALELLLRAEASECMDELFACICRQFPQVGRSNRRE